MATIAELPDKRSLGRQREVQPAMARRRSRLITRPTIGSGASCASVCGELNCARHAGPFHQHYLGRSPSRRPSSANRKAPSAWVSAGVMVIPSPTSRPVAACYSSWILDAFTAPAAARPGTIIDSWFPCRCARRSRIAGQHRNHLPAVWRSSLARRCWGVPRLR